MQYNILYILAAFCLVVNVTWSVITHFYASENNQTKLLRFIYVIMLNNFKDTRFNPLQLQMPDLLI